MIVSERGVRRLDGLARLRVQLMDEMTIDQPEHEPDQRHQDQEHWQQHLALKSQPPLRQSGSHEDASILRQSLDPQNKVHFDHTFFRHLDLLHL